MKLRIKPLDESIIFYLLLMLGCMNLMEEGSLIFVVLGCYSLIKYPLLERSAHIVAVILLVVTICLMSFATDGVSSEIIKAWNYILCYLIGSNGFYHSENKLRFIKGTMLSVFLGFLGQLTLDYWYNINHSIIAGQRLMYSIWTGKYIAVTLIGVFSSAIIGYSYYGIFLCKKWWIKVISVLAVLLTVIVNFSTATRTPVFLMVIIWSLVSIFYFVKIKENKRVKFFVWIIIMGIGILLAYFKDVFGIRTYIHSSALLNRLLSEGMETGRWKIFRDYWELMPQYLMGGNNIKRIVGVEAHNYLQQAYDMYGVVAFIAMIWITIHFIKNVFILMRRKTDIECVTLIIAVFITLFAQCCWEPILTGYPICFWLLMLFDGMMSALNKYPAEMI